MFFAAKEKDTKTKNTKKQQWEKNIQNRNPKREKTNMHCRRN